ncbi:hypothetical protein [Blastococcus sp. URHD0036]|uniref:hypothetical protein n=1 Tax=Blastococcus sp. URHD0036 TaxID=1380356 RepID=UPI000496A409|nr:hypothetical protein [Blastococcus sp. URHD0036]
MTPKKPEPERPLDDVFAQFRSSLLDSLRRAVDARSPGPLLGVASMLLNFLSSTDVEPAATSTVVRALTTLHRMETSAGALAVAILAGDADLRRWVRRDLADRGFTVPRWLADLQNCAPVDRAVEVAGPFRDVDELVVGITTPSGHAFTAIVRVDNELGARDSGGDLYERPLDTVLAGLRLPDGADIHLRDISPADARARLEAALSGIDLDAVMGTGTEWQYQRPLLRWMLGFLPAGGDATVPGSIDDVDLDAVTADFLASPWGRPWTRGGLPLLAESVLGDGLGNGIGDPLLWAPHHVRRLLSPDPSYEILEHLDADRTPELLRDVIRYGHAKRGLRPELTDRTLAAVDRYAGAFLDSVRGWDADAG